MPPKARKRKGKKRIRKLREDSKGFTPSSINRKAPDEIRVIIQIEKLTKKSDIELILGLDLL